MLVKVEGTNYVKDTETGAILSVSKSVLADNDKRKKLSKQITDRNNEINILKNKVNEISSDMNEIKSILKQILQSKQ